MKFYIYRDPLGDCFVVQGDDPRERICEIPVDESGEPYPVETLDFVDRLDESTGQVRKEARLNAQKLKSKQDRDKANKILRDLEEAKSQRIRAEAEQNVRNRSKRKSERAVVLRDLVKDESEILKLIVEQLLDQ